MVTWTLGAKLEAQKGHFLLIWLCCLCATSWVITQSLKCTCKALANELEYEIKKIGPRRTVNSGTFRINPDGTRGKKKVR
uniref:DUF3456 domain-containing protein n=1 Tax=Laticauda laticaudata TaxID=8630 RepID=A0A8C5S5X7_LATLA